MTWQLATITRHGRRRDRRGNVLPDPGAPHLYRVVLDGDELVLPPEAFGGVADQATVAIGATTYVVVGPPRVQRGDHGTVERITATVERAP